ncbi:MAG: hypothetical protein Tsb009_12450 [Planctomycetaceae bacterium]
MKSIVLIATFVILLSSTGIVHSAPTPAQRKELLSIRRGLSKISLLLRRRKITEAQSTVKQAEERLEKLLKDAQFNPRDRSVLGVKRLLQFYKARMLRAQKSASGPGSGRKAPGRTIRIPGKPGGEATLQKRTAAAQKERAEQLNRDLAYWKRRLAEASSTTDQQQADQQKAMLHIGLVLMKQKKWKPAAEIFSSLVEKHPKGSWTVVAKCRLVEMNLEHFRDMPAAQKLMKPMLLWAWDKERKEQRKEILAKRAAAKKKKQSKASSSKTETQKAEVKKSPSKPSSSTKPKPTVVAKPTVILKSGTPSFEWQPLDEKQTAAEIYQTAAIVDFALTRPASVRRYVLKAQMWAGRPVGRPSPKQIAAQRMLLACSSHRGMTPLTLWKSNKDLFHYLCFADYLLMTGEYERPLEYLSALLKDKSIKFTELQQSYLHYLRGKSYNGLRDRKQRAKAHDAFVHAHKLAPQSRWADDSLFLAANAAWNHERKAEDAIRLWKKLRQDYPKSTEADRSAFYIGVVYHQTKRYRDAKAAYETLLKEKPASSFASLIREELKKVERELSRTNSRRSR